MPHEQRLGPSVELEAFYDSEPSSSVERDGPIIP